MDIEVGSAERASSRLRKPALVVAAVACAASGYIGAIMTDDDPTALELMRRNTPEQPCDADYEGAAPLVVAPEEEDISPAVDVLSPDGRQLLMAMAAPVSNLLEPKNRVEDIVVSVNSQACLRPPDTGTLYTKFWTGTANISLQRIVVEFNPSFTVSERLAEGTMIHEAVHFLIDQLQNMEGEARPAVLKDSFTTFQMLLNDKKAGLGVWYAEQIAAGYSVTDLDGQIYDDLPKDENKRITEDDGSVFSLFDESSYYGLDLGHPYDSPGELIASAVTVLRMFPRSFERIYNGLPPSKQALAYRTMLLAIEILRAGDPVQAEKVFSPLIYELAGYEMTPNGLERIGRGGVDQK